MLLSHSLKKAKSLLEFVQLFEHAVRLSGAGASDAHQEIGFVSEHRLKFDFGQRGKILRVDECVAAAVQSHLAVYLRPVA